jgi:hypothetical protein
MMADRWEDEVAASPRPLDPQCRFRHPRTSAGISSAHVRADVRSSADTPEYRRFERRCYPRCYPLLSVVNVGCEPINLATPRRRSSPCCRSLNGAIARLAAFAERKPNLVDSFALSGTGALLLAVLRSSARLLGIRQPLVPRLKVLDVRPNEADPMRPNEPVVCDCCELDTPRDLASPLNNAYGLNRGWRCRMCNEHQGQQLKMAQDH